MAHSSLSADINLDSAIYYYNFNFLFPNSGKYFFTFI